MGSLRREPLYEGLEAILGGRAEGKSREIVKWLDGDRNRVAITFSVMAAKELVRIASVMGLVVFPDQVYSVQQVRNGLLRGRRNVAVAIDNADIVLRDLIGGAGTLELITLSTPPRHEYRQDGRCLACEQFWPCQTILELADRLAKSLPVTDETPEEIWGDGSGTPYAI